MGKKLVPASRVRLKVLESLYKGWEIRPHGYFPLRQVWSKVYEHFAPHLDNHLSEGVWETLQKEGFIDVKVGEDESDNKEAFGRITDAGRSFLEQHNDHVRTRRIAVFGAITGSAGLLLAVVKAIVDFFG